jgi:hypothetical protein
MGLKTGPMIQTVAALGHFGLFEFQGGGDNRAARLTDLALRILLDKQPISAEREELVRQAALTPRIHAELWQRWQAALPSDATLETYLVRDRGFSESGGRDLIAEYKATIAFAKLGQPAIIPTDNTGIPPASDGKDEIEVGDLIRAEIGGQDPFGKPVRVRAVQEHEGCLWVFVEDEETGIPMGQVTLEQKETTDLNPPKPPITPPRLPLPPASDRPRLPEDKPAHAGVRREVFALDEGDLVISYPENLSLASYDDLETYLQLFLRKAKRRAAEKRAQYDLDGTAPEGRI